MMTSRSEGALAARAAAARGRLHAVVDQWSDDDVFRLDALCALGRPAEVVSSVPADMRPEPADGGDVALRSATTRESSVRADVLHAWRVVSDLIGIPIPRWRCK